VDEKNLKDDSVGRRLETAVELAQLTEFPVFGLAAKPSPDARFRSLFASKDATLVKLFNNPPILRKAGFSLEHDGNSRIVMGDLRRALIPSWKILELWRDGTLIYAVDAFVQPLWGSPRQDGSLQLNPLALAEPVYLFAELSRQIYEESTQKPQRVEYRIQLERLVRDGKQTSLSEGPLEPSFFGAINQHPAPDSRMDKTITWDRGTIESGAVAYELVQEVYHWFGISDDGIPYTKKDANGDTVIDPEALKKAGEKPMFS
jgi:hypothetical protein